MPGWRGGAMGIELDIRGNVPRDGHFEPSDAPEFWSVYRREQDGCWLADFPTRAAALAWTGGRHG